MATNQVNVRLTDETLAEIDALLAKLELENRSQVIRLAIRRMARTELGTVPGDRSKPNVSNPKARKTK